jgi:hypothetical protein
MALFGFRGRARRPAHRRPLLVVCTTRPELFERRPDWGGGMGNALTVSLGSLDEVRRASIGAVHRRGRGPRHGRRRAAAAPRLGVLPRGRRDSTRLRELEALLSATA